MALTLPERIQVGPDEWYAVEHAPIPDAMGFVDYDARTIRIDCDQPEPQKHAILLHELIHLADATAVDCGAYGVRLTEEQVVGLTGALWPILASSGLWPGASEADVLEMEQYQPA